MLLIILIEISNLVKKSIITLQESGLPVFLWKLKRKISWWSQESSIISALYNNTYNLWISKNEPRTDELDKYKALSAKFSYKPKISIIIPTYDTKEEWLKEAIESVRNQCYENWELCIADGNSSTESAKNLIKEYATKDNRIKIKFLCANNGIAGNSNEALSLAEGEFIALLDHDDILSFFALYEVVKLLNIDRNYDFIYSDEDKISSDGLRRFQPFFKPDWSPDTLRSCNYITHLSVIRKSLIDKVGGFREGYDGSQDYDLILRITEKTTKIGHIPKILYHWRSHDDSTARSRGVKLYAYEAARKALSDHLKRCNKNGKVAIMREGFYRVKYDIIAPLKVSIIIPTKDKVNLLRRCITSILKKTDYLNYEILIIDNHSREARTFAYYDEIKDNSRINILHYDKPFNFSEINNFAVSQSNSEYILFLNNDTEVIADEWLTAMVEHIQRKEVGAVGVLLYYPNKMIQHAGVIVGIGGRAGHPYKLHYSWNPGHFFRPAIIQNLSAVTGACLMTRRDVFREIGGFDQIFPNILGDIDLCLKIRKLGYLIVYTPYAELYHYENMSGGSSNGNVAALSKAVTNFQNKWKNILDEGDPYYNPNLTRTKENFSLRV